jgi:hypothetical protein
VVCPCAQALSAHDNPIFPYTIMGSSERLRTLLLHSTVELPCFTNRASLRRSACFPASSADNAAPVWQDVSSHSDCAVRALDLNFVLTMLLFCFVLNAFQMPFYQQMGYVSPIPSINQVSSCVLVSLRGRTVAGPRTSPCSMARLLRSLFAFPFAPRDL